MIKSTSQHAAESGLPDPQPTDAPQPVTSFTFYGTELAALKKYEQRARAYARSQDERFRGLSFDVDTDGCVHINAAGLDPIRL